MESLREIITIISASLGLFATIIGFLIPLIKNIKAKNKLVAIKKLTSTLQSLIIDAEAFVNFSGEEKKEYVLTKANRFAIDNKIPYNEADISEKIEKLICLSKEVNKRESTSVSPAPVQESKVVTSIRI